jgi:DNA helicase-2/ATP-dependent DNA helicase PcrA
MATKYTAGEELEAVVNSLRHWLPENPDRTVAVLVPRNERGEAAVNALKAAGIEYVELLRSTGDTRAAAGALANVVNYLADPASPRKLATAYEVWRRTDRDDPDAKLRLDAATRALRRCRQVEDFLWPRGFEAHDDDSLACLELPDDDFLLEQLRRFRDLVRRWQGATMLPADQLILTIGQDLFERPADLAITHKLAALLRNAGASHPDWRLPELNQELITIAKNERKFLGFSAQDTGFDPEAHRGKVVVATVHKAKGLEWDRVYLMSVNAYDFPSALPGDSFISERWFIRDSLNLEAEALAQLKAVAAGDLGALSAVPGIATGQARLDYAAERLRLLYVAITRAKRELIVTSNTGRLPGAALQPAAPLIALQTWWKSRGA